jgi:hypothetical protein
MAAVIVSGFVGSALPFVNPVIASINSFASLAIGELLSFAALPNSGISLATFLYVSCNAYTAATYRFVILLIISWPLKVGAACPCYC